MLYTDTGMGRRPSAWQRLQQTFIRPPAQRPQGEQPDITYMSDDEKRAFIIHIDPNERKVGMVAAVLGIALAIYANVPYMVSKIAVNDSAVKPKHGVCAAGLTYASTTNTCKIIYPPSHYVLPIVVDLVLSIAIYVTVRIGRRSPLAFTMIMTGLAFGSMIIIIPFAIGGGWIMLRSWRTQRRGSPTAKAPLPGWIPPTPRGATRRPKSTGPRQSRPRRGEETPKTRKPPVANKRYTPKSPPKKKASRTS